MPVFCRLKLNALLRVGTRAAVTATACIALMGLLGLAPKLELFGAPPAAAAEISAKAAPARRQDELRRFRAFLGSLFAEATARGVSRATFTAAFRDLTPDLAILKAPRRQSEFQLAFSTYFKRAVSQRRIAQGRLLARQWRRQLAQISRRFGVPGPILLAAWGMESNFGHYMGKKDIIRSLATLAFRDPHRPLYRRELLDALVMLQRHLVPRATLRGSWAGAMGGPQFLPSTYLADAVSFTGHAPPDIWTNAPDVLASIAKFLHASGWRRGAPWGMEVVLPPHFGYPTLHADFRFWRAQGVRRADARPLPRRGRATLFLPAGAKGPAFLLAHDYWVIKTYNNSDSYALSFARLADEIAGRPPLHKAWPKGVKLWRRDQRLEIQRLLRHLGYYKGRIDGRFGPTSRDAIHAFQLATGDQPADGIGGADLLARLRQQAKR